MRMVTMTRMALQLNPKPLMVMVATAFRCARSVVTWAETGQTKPERERLW